MTKKLRENVAVVKDLMTGGGLSTTQIKERHPHLSDAVDQVLTEQAAEKPGNRGSCESGTPTEYA